MTVRQQIAFSHCVASGYHPFGVAAIVGNGCGESGENLDSTFERAHADHGSGGFLEWRDSSGAPRKSRLAAYADERGQGLRDDLLVQCDYAIWELGQFFPALDAQLRTPGARAIKNLTANFCWVFENPARETAGLDNRIAHAEKAYADWSDARGKEPPVVVAGEPATAPSVPMPTPAMPIDATNAGRQAAVLDQMHILQQAYISQIAMLEKEKAVVDAAIQSFAVFLPAPSATPIALPSPTEAKDASPPRKIPMFKNWQTTASGIGALLGAAAAILHSVSIGQMPDITQLSLIFGVISAGFVGLNAKDQNVTGGTVPATPEAARRTGTAV